MDKNQDLEADFWAELAHIKEDAFEWIPLEEGAFLHVGSDKQTIQLVGVVTKEMTDISVLWLI